MFCPACGSKDTNSSQFCRACGGDLRGVRNVVSAPDKITASAANAREEIGRAIAMKIRETRSAKDLAKVTQEVLPEVEKFLESPEEKRLRRLRTGIIIASVGLGVAIGLSIASSMQNKEEFLFLAAMGLVTFFIGLGFILNGYFLSVPKKEAADNSFAADRQRELDAAEYTRPELQQPAAQSFVSSVTEHTTRQLEEEDIVVRNRSNQL